MKNPEEIRGVVSQVFARQQERVCGDMQELYRRLCGELNERAPSSWEQHIRNLETLRVSSYIYDLQYDIKQELLSTCLTAGLIPENMTELMWADAAANISLPEVNLLEYVAASDEADAGQQATPGKVAPPQGTWVPLAVGVALEVIGWVFLPHSRVWRPVIQGIGLASIAVGTVRLVGELKGNSGIALNDDYKAQLRRKALEEMTRACDESCETNVKNIQDWMNRLQEAVIARLCQEP